jgi:CRP/FNR family transcriptional regulator, dissimilatory nitrate respiration regulator
MNKLIIETLQQTALFNHLSEEKIEAMAQFSSIKKYEKDTIVFLEQEEPKSFMIVMSGRVKVYKTDLKANEILLHQFTKLDMLAEMPLFANINYPSSAAFETDGSLLHIDFKRFKETFFSDSEVAFGFVYSLSKKMEHMNHLINQNMVLDATSRVAKFLFDNEKNLKDIKQKDMANKLHIQAETLSRLLKKLMTMGLVEKRSQYYEVVNHEGLKELFSLE